MIEPQAGLTDAGITLSYMAEAEPWSGDTTIRGVRRRSAIRRFSTADSMVGFPATFSWIDSTGQTDPNETGWMGLVRPGDKIQFGGGQWFQITSGEPFSIPIATASGTTRNPTTIWMADAAYDGPVLVKGAYQRTPLDPEQWWPSIRQPWCPPRGHFGTQRGLRNLDGTWDPADPMACRRNSWTINGPASVSPSAGSRPRRRPHPLQLPNAMVVDLAWSGTDGLPSLNGLGPITVLFTPTGALQQHLLLSEQPGPGHEPQRPAVPAGGQGGERRHTAASNYEDLTNFWVTIHPQTGLITSTEVGPGGERATAPPRSPSTRRGLCPARPGPGRKMSDENEAHELESTQLPPACVLAARCCWVLEYSVLSTDPASACWRS